LIENQSSYKVDMNTFNDIKEKSHNMFNLGEGVIKHINTLRKDRQAMAKVPFVFKKKDLVGVIKGEI